LSAPYPRPCLAAMQRFLVVAALAFSVAAGDAERLRGSRSEAVAKDAETPRQVTESQPETALGANDTNVTENATFNATPNSTLNATLNSTLNATLNATLNTTTQAPVVELGPVMVSTFFWNVHWQCSVAARGSSPACKGRAAQRFQELAQGASIVASVELSNGMSEPLTLIPGWTQVNGPCARGYGGDSVALSFEPGWTVEASGGGCLRHDWDTRAYAVARVQPPAPVEGCPSLCVIAVHAPHRSITVGGDVVRGICGQAVQRCTVAMGDWNVDADQLYSRWGELVGDAGLTTIAPNERTCCWPEGQHYGIYDHVASNIAGASAEGFLVHPYQILEENPVQQHRPVSVRLALPRA